MRRRMGRRMGRQLRRMGRQPQPGGGPPSPTPIFGHFAQLFSDFLQFSSSFRKKEQKAPLGESLHIFEVLFSELAAAFPLFSVRSWGSLGH